MQNDTDKANFRCTADKIVYFVVSAERRILTLERVDAKYTIIFFRTVFLIASS